MPDEIVDKKILSQAQVNKVFNGICPYCNGTDLVHVAKKSIIWSCGKCGIFTVESLSINYK
ncbi:hypothetical protein LCGC14_2233000, partial [marine sediment metagenome]